MQILAFAIPGLGPVSAFFANALKVLSSFTGSFGWAIILLTLGFRIVTLPLTIKQTKSMIAMQKLQPQLKEIQKKYKDDREKMGQEMMGLYKENKVSPLGGCLPLLIQLPILFALFDVLHNVTKYPQLKDLNYAFLGITNILATGKVMWSGGTIKFWDAAGKISTKVPYHGGEYAAVIILILLTVITGYISAKMMTTDPKQAKMMALMPVVFGFFAWILPAGVTIYIIVINALTIMQQYFQLSREGFYEERREQRDKEGASPSLAERLTGPARQRVTNAFAALRGKTAQESGKGKKAEAAKASGAEAARGQKKTGAKVQPDRKPGAKAGKSGQAAAGKPRATEKPGTGPEGGAGKESSGKPPGEKAVKKAYPAKKKK